MINQEYLEKIFSEALTRGASDVHFSVGRPPILRIDGELEEIEREKVLTPEDASSLCPLLMKKEQQEIFYIEKDMDFAYDFQGKIRMRINAFYQRGFVSFAIRIIPPQIRTIEELHLPSILHTFTSMQQGLILVCGPAGHGKSTTLAAMVDEINHKRKEHIITIEDPIEYIFQQDKSIINQRELGFDTKDYPTALRAALRQDPDVLLIGDMRDRETMSAALTAAETGHLVFSTLHTNSASQTIDRIIDSFPPDQQDQIRIQLASSFAGVISQRLLQRIMGGRIPACEIMVASPAISNLIREKRTFEIDVVISTSREKGMISLNHYLAELINQREITFEEASKYSLNPRELKLILKRI
ncbi:MAG: PilT/PilU family type 4a pilus ATPase [Candidatus Pacebacteria bacterium]|nr:PilT/PilU family type 4a pilus ATPase [Candidatus Paceibacterota bacterium]